MGQADAFERGITECAEAVDQRLQKAIGGRGKLPEAMRYAALGSGTRFRPFLLIQTAKLFGVPLSKSLNAAAALECIHRYSLVHDDLPQLDDDDTRRGAPTVHKKFDEATAILTGDALLTLAFELMNSPDTHTDPTTRSELSLDLARAAGREGMVLGQALDLGANVTSKGIERVHALKTGALITFAIKAGAILGGAKPTERASLLRFGLHLGAAFQIADDLEDSKRDAEAGHTNLIAVVGRGRAKELLEREEGAALTALKPFKNRAEILREAARFISRRDRGDGQYKAKRDKHTKRKEK